MSKLLSRLVRALAVPLALSALLAASALGYSLQGLAVVGGLLSSRGMPPVLVTLALLFVLVVTVFWILPALAVLGLSDVWLDHRRLEPSSQEEA